MRHHIPPNEWFDTKRTEAESLSFDDITEDEFNEGCGVKEAALSCILWRMEVLQ